MKNHRKFYYNKKWFDFSKLVKSRDGNKCLKCGRAEPDVVLQTHHKNYKPRVKPWEYPLSDCITLCKGCHSREHGIVEPDSGWILISIEDLGSKDGICQRKGCGTEIRYEHITYHPQWGHKTVGSTCVEHLTREDQFLSKEVLKIFKKTSDFVKNSIWKQGKTKNGNTYLHTIHTHHKVRIYGKEGYYAFLVSLKEKGVKWYINQDYIKVKKDKNLDQVKELSYLVLKGLTTKSKKEKEMLRNIYARIR